MEHVVKEYGKAVMASLIVIICIGILVSGVFIGTSGLNATGARGLAGAAAEIKEEDVTENRAGPELNDIAAVPDGFQMECQTQIYVEESVNVNSVFAATDGEGKAFSVSITQIKDAQGDDALAKGKAELSDREVLLHTPGTYQFYVRVVPLDVTRSFTMHCIER